MTIEMIHIIVNLILLFVLWCLKLISCKVHLIVGGISLGITENPPPEKIVGVWRFIRAHEQ